MRSFLSVLIVACIPSGLAPMAMAADVVAPVSGSVSGITHVDVLGLAHVSSGPALSPISVTFADAAGLETVEITALDTGQTILALPIADGREGRDGILLSAAAASQLGLPGNGGVVRVRGAVASPQDIALLQAGKAAAPRLPAPPAMILALRQRYDAGEHVLAAATPAPDVPRDDMIAGTPRPAIAPLTVEIPKPESSWGESVAQKAVTGFFVQVAALGDRVKAVKLADMFKDIAAPRLSDVGALTRVQIGPFNSIAAAQQALAEVRARGYVDARILHIP